MILIHIQRRTTDGIGTELARAQVMDEAEGGDDEGGGAGELGAAVGGWVVPVWQKEKGMMGSVHRLCKTRVYAVAGPMLLFVHPSKGKRVLATAVPSIPLLDGDHKSNVEYMR